MSLILSMDLSTESASICLAENEDCLCLLTNNRQKDHASWLHTSIKQAFTDTGKNLIELDAVGLTAGPGSYTGLRVGMATAKGLCYALKIPLVLLNTLEVMARMAVSAGTDYICPMIDARRMEVYTAVYDNEMNQLVAPCAMVLDKHSFSDYVEHHSMVFFGNGKDKFEPLLRHDRALFIDLPFDASHLARDIYAKYNRVEFADLAYVEPIYLKN
ncbi:MAG: tRNA (adenosine(37)-N6)-threonylcarbamoyltransferase complex dimerization subunit type 1 TsaB [Chitinophagaceae bacterium]